jgi:DNA-binding PadR family transcriptional regulator
MKTPQLPLRLAAQKAVVNSSVGHQDPLLPLTHLQFLVLDEIGAGNISGQELRMRLANHGVRKSAPAFYQLMARLEEAKFVEGWYEQTQVEGQAIKQRRYKVTGVGASARRQTAEFYWRRGEAYA